MSDGCPVYECTSDDEVIDLLRGGQGHVRHRSGRRLARHRGSLSALPSERVHEEPHAEAHGADELSQRRRAR